MAFIWDATSHIDGSRRGVNRIRPLDKHHPATSAVPVLRSPKAACPRIEQLGQIVRVSYSSKLQAAWASRAAMALRSARLQANKA